MCGWVPSDSDSRRARAQTDSVGVLYGVLYVINKVVPFVCALWCGDKQETGQAEEDKESKEASKQGM